MVTIFHNNRCGKSREALALLQAQTQDQIEVIHYLTQPPTPEELKSLLAKLWLAPQDVIRKKEKLYLEVYAGQHLTADEWLQVLHENPILLERPIVVNGARAVISRPPEAVLSIL